MAKPSDKELKQMATAKSKHATMKERVDALEQVTESFLNNIYKYGKAIEDLEKDVAIIKANLTAPAENDTNQEDVEFWEDLIKDVDRLKSKMGM